MFEPSFAKAFDNWMISLLLWMSPFAGVVLADFYIKRRGQIDVPELYRAPEASAYGDINWAGIVAFIAGLVAGWTVQNGLVPALQGPISTGLLGGADLSWLVGILVSGASTWRLARAPCPYGSSGSSREVDRHGKSMARRRKRHAASLLHDESQLTQIRPSTRGRICRRSGRLHAAAIAILEDRPNESVEPLCLRIMQIARQAERVAADVYVLLQHVGALLGIADNADAGSRPCFGKAGPQVRCDQIAHGTGQLLHALIGNRLRVVGPDVVGALGRHVADQGFGRLPSILLVLAADDLQAHAEAQSRARGRVCAANCRNDLMLAAICSVVSPQNRCTSECLADSSAACREPPPK